ncbi:VOC family protein [Mycobacterium sp. NPDC050441]|uniref:VOC family protein n=1 Tax=Mycobacterium sp. NPDC050441 TaxID=3155403 RepID=UPI0034033BE9
MSPPARTIAIKDMAAVIATGRFEAAKHWYARLLDREPDLEPVPGVAEWQLTATAWLQVVTDPVGAGRTAVRFGIDDLEATVARLRGDGVTVGEPQVIADMVAVIDVADPDGNEVSFVADLA